MEFICNDCLYYLPIDVFKGICKKTKKNILPEQIEKPCFEQGQKCRFCINFTASDENDQIGSCMGKAFAYPDMAAKTCRNFIRK